MSNKIIICLFIITTTVGFKNSSYAISAKEIGAISLINYEEIQNTKGTISFRIVNDNNDSVIGAVFGLYKADELIDEQVSNNQGTINFEAVNFGDYYIKQVFTPSNYLSDDNIYNVTLSNTHPNIVLDNIVNIEKKVTFEIMQQVSKKTATVNQSFTYSVTIKNTGNENVSNVTIVDNIPQYLDIIEVNSGTIENNKITYVMPQFDINQEITLIIQVKVTSKVTKEEQVENEVIINDTIINKLASTLQVATDKTTLDNSNDDNDVVVNAPYPFNNHKLVGISPIKANSTNSASISPSIIFGALGLTTILGVIFNYIKYRK